MAGINRFGYYSWSQVEERKQRKIPCVFLSHSSKDKETVGLFANLITARGIDVYFDAKDSKLQSAVARDDEAEIVECIQTGLRNSTHALCIMSNHTVESQWVPYEIGYFASLQRELALLPLAEVHSLPQFYKVSTLLETRWDLNTYLDRMSGTKYYTLSESIQKSFSASGISNSILPSDRRITFR